MDSERYDAAVARFTAINSTDPDSTQLEGVCTPKAVAHAARLADWIKRLAPDANEALRLAAHCQHIERWTTPRTEYPQGRQGYLKWRKDRAKFHAATATKILAELGYGESVIDEVRRINLKIGLGANSTTQTMEDALCLTFLQYEALEFAGKHDRNKVIAILRKTWVKLSAGGQQAALSLCLPPAVRALLEAALVAD